MGCGHPNRRVSTLRYVISPLQGRFIIYVRVPRGSLLFLASIAPVGGSYLSIGSWPYVTNDIPHPHQSPPHHHHTQHRNSEKMQKNGGTLAEMMYIRTMNN